MLFLIWFFLYRNDYYLSSIRWNQWEGFMATKKIVNTTTHTASRIRQRTTKKGRKGQIMGRYHNDWSAFVEILFIRLTGLIEKSSLVFGFPFDPGIDNNDSIGISRNSCSGNSRWLWIRETLCKNFPETWVRKCRSYATLGRRWPGFTHPHERRSGSSRVQTPTSHQYRPSCSTKITFRCYFFQSCQRNSGHEWKIFYPGRWPCKYSRAKNWDGWSENPRRSCNPGRDWDHSGR